MTLRLELEQNEDKKMVCSFFQMLIRFVVGAVIFEFDKVSMSNFVKFEFLCMTLKIERVLKKQTQF